MRRNWGLKTLCRELLGISVQDHVESGHNSVEDAFAARKLVLWCLENTSELNAWGARKKTEILRKLRSTKPGKTRRDQERCFQSCTTVDVCLESSI